jgi:hypothetical protein
MVSAAAKVKTARIGEPDATDAHFLFARCNTRHKEPAE